MRTMKQVMADAIDYLNNISLEYLFQVNDLKLPLPGPNEEMMHELYFTKTHKECGKRQRLFTYSYTCCPEEEVEMKELTYERIVLELIAYKLYHYDPDYREPRR